MKRPINKGRSQQIYETRTPPLSALERFQAVGLRLAGFLHQFKTPLHVIQSQTELLMDDRSLSPSVRRSLELIYQNAGRLDIQTRILLDAARGSKQDMKTASLDELLSSICQAAEADCRKKKITLEKEIMPVSPVQMDPVALEGALHNLINNAIEAMSGGGRLKVRIFEVRKPSHRVGVEIADTGKGMDQAAFHRVMKSPFETTKAEGTGLGLYITRHILKRHKATMRWENKPGKGLKVIVLFPCVRFETRHSPQPLAGNPSRLDDRVPTITSGVTHERGLFRRLLGAFAILAILLAPLSAARFPQFLRLQGHFTDSKVPLTDNLPVRFTIWDVQDGYGNLLWEDIQNVSVSNDTFQVVLGKSKAITPSVFSGGDRWVELQIGSDAPLRPRYKIPNQYLQAHVAAVQAVPAPVVAPAPPAPAEMTDQERRDLELQIEKYKEPEQTEQAPAPAKPTRKKHIVPVAQESGELGTTYEVKAGDTLKSIAQKLYGNAELWYDLYYLNRDRLGPMGHLFPGQILVLPSSAPGVQPK